LKILDSILIDRTWENLLVQLTACAHYEGIAAGFLDPANSQMHD